MDITIIPSAAKIRIILKKFQKPLDKREGLLYNGFRMILKSFNNITE